MAGRPFVPTALKAVNGTLNQTRQNWNEPKVQPEIPEPPGHLSELEKECWALFAKLLAPLGVVGATDVVAFELLAVTYAHHRRLAQAMRDASTFVYSPTKGSGKSERIMLRARPEMGMLREADRQLLALLSRFGLTPADRQRVVSETGVCEEDDPEDEFSQQ